MTKYLCNIEVPSSIITPIDAAVRFPEVLESSYTKYESDIRAFCDLIATSESSAQLLDRIRSPKVNKDTRMSMLKMFRRCVAPVLDTALKRPGFSGGSFHWAMQPYRGSRWLHSNCLRPQRAGCAR